jgi:hypothetical protein
MERKIKAVFSMMEYQLGPVSNTENKQRCSDSQPTSLMDILQKSLTLP